MNEYALGTLATISSNPSHPRVLALTASRSSDVDMVRHTERDALIMDFNRACHAMQSELKDLIIEAETSIEVLEHLNAHLVVIFKTVLTTSALVSSSEANVVSCSQNLVPLGTHAASCF